ncbi:LysR family transcriptional regulator [Methylomonas sp. MS20]|uniref:LysR family transcriptional regulator n=1 Tax=unclassified Methylomonas TaxID=2608980 RepID=UPI0028A3E7CE|nr:LysR family transcriptional regulator [Methylomonas sp. MV1]MDT4329668.1 LysR family transcriptional regulator [Methylomonas sp. MV1]
MDNIIPLEQQYPGIEPNDLWLFAKVADCGSFSRAAEAVGLPKSSLSRRIALLEQRLGERLLQRTTRKLTLTELGERLREHGRQIGEETNAAAAWAAHRQVTPSGRLRLSVPGDFASLALAPLLAEFGERYPDVMLALDLSPRRVDLVGEGYDLAIRVGELADDTTLAAKRLDRFEFGLYAAPHYLARAGTPDHPRQLAEHTALHLVAANQEIAPWRLRRGEELWTGLPPAAVTANSPELLVKLARLGRGIVAAPKVYGELSLHTGELVRLLADWQLPGVDVWAVFPGRKLMPTKTRVFLDFLAERFGKGAF